eukprot:974602_1
MMNAEAFGSNQIYGFSPALDIQDIRNRTTPRKLNDGSEDSILKVLLIGSADIRHVLKTMCRTRRHPPRTIHFYVYEGTLECLARHFLFVRIAEDRHISPKERSQLFLEMYGNTLLRDKTNSYLVEKAKEILRFFELGSGPLSRYFDLSQLKHRERDEIEEIVRFWKSKTPFDVKQLRDLRLRKFYKDRYDVRRNLVDWDYIMDVRANASIVHSAHYQEFRESGLAFKLRACDYSVPNRTVATHRLGTDTRRGTACSVRGFWSDLIMSPYLGFGVRSSETSLFKVSNRQHVKTAVDVSEFNLSSLFVELESGDTVGLCEDGDIKKTEATTCAKIEVIEDETENGEPEDDISSDVLTKSSECDTDSHQFFPDVKIIPLCCSLSGRIVSKPKFHHFFDHAVLSAAHYKLLSEGLGEVMTA